MGEPGGYVTWGVCNSGLELGWRLSWPWESSESNEKPETGMRTARIYAITTRQALFPELPLHAALQSSLQPQDADTSIISLSQVRNLRGMELKWLKTAMHRSWQSWEVNLSSLAPKSMLLLGGWGRESSQGENVGNHEVNPRATRKGNKRLEKRDRGQGHRSQEVWPPAAGCWLGGEQEPKLFGVL